MWFNATSQYAILAVLFVAGREAEGTVRVDDIATALACPRNYLSKTLHALVQSGVLRSTRGPRGGFRLADRPARLTLDRVVAPFEQLGVRRCLIGRPECGGRHPCLVHARWERVAAAASAFFSQTTVADLLASGRGSLAVPLAARRPRRPQG